MKKRLLFVSLISGMIVLLYLLSSVPYRVNQFALSSLVISSIEGLPLQIEYPPAPEPGKASISGVLYTFTGKGPIPQTAFYLVPALGESSPYPPLILLGPRSEDPQGRSDIRGRIVVNNIQPGTYYLAVWAPYGWILAVQSETESSFLVLNLKPNQRLNLGIIYVPWP
jgi:hypothetical protein